MTTPIEFDDYEDAKEYGLRKRAEGYRARVKPRGGKWQVVLREKKGSPPLPRDASLSDAMEAPRTPSPPSFTPRPPRATAVEGMRLSALRMPSGMPRAPRPGVEDYGISGESLLRQPASARGLSRTSRLRSPEGVGELLKWQPQIGGGLGPRRRTEETEEEE